MTDTINLHDLRDAELNARRNGRDDAADALRRRRLSIADNEFVCGRCGSHNTDDVLTHDDHATPYRFFALTCANCGTVGKKVDGLTGDRRVKYSGDVTLVEYR